DDVEVAQDHHARQEHLPDQEDHADHETLIQDECLGEEAPEEVVIESDDDSDHQHAIPLRGTAASAGRKRPEERSILTAKRTRTTDVRKAPPKIETGFAQGGMKNSFAAAFQEAVAKKSEERVESVKLAFEKQKWEKDLDASGQEKKWKFTMEKMRIVQVAAEKSSRWLMSRK
ncbi:hypothetical protein EC968_009382, partial [Mortierella alpina]